MIRPRGMAWAARPVLVLATGWLVLCAGAVSGLGQMDHLPPGIPSGGPPVGMMPVQEAPAAIDTALAILEFPAADPLPIAIHTVQDTVLFGDVFHLILDYSGQLVGLPEVRLAADEDWLLPSPEEKPGLLGRILGRILGSNVAPPPDMSALPAAGDRVRLVQSFRVYRTDPFRLQAGFFTSPVIQVKGRVAGTDETAGIRTPRSSGWSPLLVPGLFVLLLLVLWLAWLLWGRDSRREDLADRELPEPAWLTAAFELRDLLRAGSLNQGDERAFLDGLAGIVRRFVTGRYRIAAQEMTGREIITACACLGHRSTQPGIFARMIDAVDRRRYDPEVCGSAWCREQAVLLYGQMARVRILPRYSEVSTDLRYAGETAWVELERELSPGTGRLRDSGAVASGWEA